uniref:Uncharacterized protein n=1 Tax=Anguilla anguilla TaxID=7936 RepID=A0A0E9VAG6_ANGAN
MSSIAAKYVATATLGTHCQRKSAFDHPNWCVVTLLSTAVTKGA